MSTASCAEDLEATIRRAVESREKADCEEHWLRERIRYTILDFDDNVDHDWYVLFCRICDPDLDSPHLFYSMRGRGRWAGMHTVLSGHRDQWMVYDWFHLVETVRAPHFESVACQHENHEACGRVCGSCALPCRCDCHKV